MPPGQVRRQRGPRFHWPKFRQLERSEHRDWNEKYKPCSMTSGRHPCPLAPIPEAFAATATHFPARGGHPVAPVPLLP